MTDFITYDAKVAVVIAVFYMFYRLLLSRDTFHRVNRIVLLLTATAGFLLPLLRLTFHKTVVVSADMFGDMGVATETTGETIATDATPLWQTVVAVVFVVGAIGTLAHTLLSLYRVASVIRKCERHRESDGTIIAVSDESLSPFSFMNVIVLSRADYAERNAAILIHERAHIHLRHSVDVLVVDVLSSLQWFNPAMWMLRADLRTIHEYEADEAVLTADIDTRSYQYLLVKKAVADGGYSVANSFNNSTLKNRITMMLKKKSSKRSMSKLLLAIPVVGVALAVNARTVTEFEIMPATAQTASPATETVAPTTALDGMTAATVQKSDTAKAKKKMVSKASKTESLDDMTLYIDGKKATYDELKNIKPSEIKDFLVDKKNNSIKITLKKGNDDKTKKKAAGDDKENATVESQNNVTTISKKQIHSLDGLKIYVDGKEASKDEINNIKSSDIKDIVVDKKNNELKVTLKKEGDKVTEKNTVSDNVVVQVLEKLKNKNNLKNPIYFVDGKLVSDDEMKKINEEDIHAISVLKEYNAIMIALKKKEGETK